MTEAEGKPVDHIKPTPAPIGCTHKGCKEVATHYPCLNIPRVHTPLDSHRPITLVLSVPYCEHHVAKFPLWLTEKTKKRLNTGALDHVPGQLDFGRAFITSELINGKMALMFNLMGGLDKDCRPLRRGVIKI